MNLQIVDFIAGLCCGLLIGALILWLIYRTKLAQEIGRGDAKVAALEAEKAIFTQERELYMEQKFENLGNKIFKEHNQNFKTELLAPLKGDIEGFKKKLEESFNTQAKEQYSLKAEIERIVKINEHMTSETSNLTKALKGDSKTQGSWGEVILERILEESGLRCGEDYILQGAEMDLKHPETGAVLKPDVVVKLPENKHIIIDSKVSLTHYERFCATQDETYLKQFISSIKKHVSDLEVRRYQDADKLKTPDFVLMFMPIEGAFSLAMQEEPELHSHAWGKKVVIVCPSTLFATLRTISSIWRLELQHKNVLEIAKRGGLLYDKVAGFVKDMLSLGKQLEISQTTYQNAMDKLQDSKGNMLQQTEELKRLGAKASKNLTEIIPQAFEELV